MKNFIVGLIILFTLSGCQTTLIVTNFPDDPQPEPQPYTGPEYNQFACDVNLTRVLVQTNIDTCYDNGLIASRAVQYTLKAEYVNTLNITKRPSFKVDPNVMNGANTKDYTHSGFDRGHLAPDAAFDYDHDDLKQIYFMTNIVPMNPSVNRYKWSKLETYARTKAVEYGEIHVLNGVEYGLLPSRLTGIHKVAIPVSYWKRLRNLDGTFDECYKYDNHGATASDLASHRLECSNLVVFSE